MDAGSLTPQAPSAYSHFIWRCCFRFDTNSQMSSNGQALLSYFEEHRPEMLELARWLVEQESMSREAEALRRLAEALAQKLSDITDEVERLSDPRCGASVLARFEAAGQPSTDDRRLRVVGHF